VKVVDTNVIIHGRGLDEKALTTPEAIAELKSDYSKTRSLALDIETAQPSKESIEKVEQKSREICSSTSEVDESLLALAIDREVVLMTDDKGLQNLAHHLEAKVEGFLDDVASRKISWVMKCPSCGKETEKMCTSCGINPVRKRDQYSSV